ncbi:MAG TPA: metallophosphoesterase [Actinomycetota bacterium]|nr:metallophosphoesterase [Actinomycetota bacterium]
MRKGLALVGAGAAVGAYSLWERRAYRLVEHDVPVDATVPSLSILHVSDTHLTAREGKLISWLRGLPDRLGRVPDLVLATGDLIEDDTGIEPLVDALSGLEARLGRFYVLGSHDYYQAKFQPYTKYFARESRDISAPPADTELMEDGLVANGWEPLINAAARLETDGGVLLLAGVDDPYLGRHTTQHIRRDEDVVLAIGLVHAPNVVSEWALNRFDLVVAGHTHGGQVRIPGVGALVTNCKLPTGLAMGLNRVGACWIHVSPGLGTSSYSPIRFNCFPEATLLNLVPRLP